jgi:gluconokinase
VVIVIVMGVSGCGKSTVGFGVAANLGWPFLDGDDLHPPANVAKMAAGHPLTDADRAPWLEAIGEHMAAWHDAGRSGVMACSALRRSYRDALRAHSPATFVLLDVSVELLRARVAHRREHFMPPSLLDSQLATLQRPGPDEDAITIAITSEVPPGELVARVLSELSLSDADAV